MFYSLILSLAFAQTPRLSTNQFDLSKVANIRISPGLVSVLEFPQNIIEVRVGNPKSIKALISQVSPKELTLFLSSSLSQPSNLIVRSEKRVFVFDIVPSRNNHQDYYKISSAYGSPNSESNHKKLIAQSSLSPEVPKRIGSTKSSSQRLGP